MLKLLRNLILISTLTISWFKLFSDLKFWMPTRITNLLPALLWWMLFETTNRTFFFKLSSAKQCCWLNRRRTKQLSLRFLFLRHWEGILNTWQRHNHHYLTSLITILIIKSIQKLKQPLLFFLFTQSTQEQRNFWWNNWNYRQQINTIKFFPHTFHLSVVLTDWTTRPSDLICIFIQLILPWSIT